MVKNYYHTVLMVAWLVNSSIVVAARVPQVQAEASISTTTPYVQQTVVYTVRAVSQTNVLEFSLDPPTVPGAALELLEDKPRTYARTTPNGQLVINEYRYALTPLVAGHIEIPPTQLSGKAEPLSQGQYQGSTQREIAFKARTKLMSFQSRLAPPSAVQPWLPIQTLVLVKEGEIQHARIGEPFTLSLWLRAVGVKGQRLPDLAALLQGPDFRIYPEKAVEYWQGATSDGSAVRGQRHETLTIVPLKTGILRLPAIRIPWWDTTKDLPTNLEWQHPEITVTDALGTPTSGGYLGGIAAWLLTLTTIVFIFLFGWWVGRSQPQAMGLTGIVQRILNGWHRSGEYLRPTILKFRHQAELCYRAVVTYLDVFLKQHLKAKFAVFTKFPLAVKFQQWLSRIVPISFRTQRLLHHIQNANNVETIFEVLMVYATTLELPRNSPLAVVAESMGSAHPELDGSALLKLFHQIDTALYGNKNTVPENAKRLDIKHWQQNFLEIMRPLRHFTRRAVIIDSKGLPPLNK